MSQSPLLKPEIPSGTVIDNRYLIQKLLGQGGLGRTYLAFDTRRFNEPCVLKEFAPIGTGKNELEKCRNLFIREAKILYQLTHPQIPRFLACFEGDGRLFLVQEFVDGKTYSSILGERQAAGQSFSESEAIQWLKDILPILQYVHEHNIIHRDISPDNIMLPEGQNIPVLIDFGVGKQIADIQEVGTSNQTFTFVGKMSLVGKVGYAPREQISLGVCSSSSDIYALGVTTIVLLTGKDPSLLMDQYTLEWRWHSYVNVSPGFATIIDKMLADIPRNRYQTSQEVIADLENLTANPIAPTDIKKEEIPPTTLAIVDNVEESSTTTTDVVESTPETQVYVDSFAAAKESEFPATSFDNWQELPVTSVSNEDLVEVDSQLPPKSETIDASVNQFFADSEPIFTEPPSSVKKSSETVFSSPITTENDQFTSSYETQHNTSYQHQHNTSLDPFFIERCQEELAYYIGPMASMIVEDTLIDNPQASAYQVVEILAREIPESQSALEFARKILR